MPHNLSPHPRTTASPHTHSARHYNSALSIWLSVDPMADKYPGTSPYTYCANNPVRLVDPDGRDPIYGRNFWGKIKKIGDDGKANNRAYLVKGKVKKDVKSSTRNDQFYEGSLEASEEVMHIPTGFILQRVQETVKNVMESGAVAEQQVEYGGHALKGQNDAVIWDPGEPMVIQEIKNGYIKRWSIEPFVKDGAKLYNFKLSDMEFYWHVQPTDDFPSTSDINHDTRYRDKGKYSGTTFVIGVENGRVTFYKGDKLLIRIYYDQMVKMGKGEL